MPCQLSLPGLLRPVELARPATSIDALHSYPDVTPDVLCEHAKAIGAAGEKLLDSLLMRYGETVSDLPEWLPADRVLIRPRRSLTIQVKTTTHADRRGTFSFPMKKGYRGNPNGMRPYETGDYDIAALVVLPENVIRFVAGHHPVHRIARSEIPDLRAAPRASFEAALAALDGRDPDPAMPLAAVA